MAITGVKYVGPVLERTASAQAGRQLAVALHQAGNPDARQGLLNNPIEYDTLLLHGTPDQWARFREPDKRNLGLTEWFTSRLHPDWPPAIDASVDACIVPSQWNRAVLEASGVQAPVRTLPYSLDPEEFSSVPPRPVAGVDDGAFKFYAIVDFTEQCHPTALVRAYWAAFQQNDRVALILRAERNDLGPRAHTAITRTLKRLKQVTPLDRYPPVHLIVDDLDRDQLLGLHAFGECLVSLDRGRAFGLAALEAGAAGNPVMATGFGGIRELIDDETGYLVRHGLTPVSGMSANPWCRGDQLWAEPDCGHAIELFRHIRANSAEAAARGARLQARIGKGFTGAQVARQFLDLAAPLAGNRT